MDPKLETLKIETHCSQRRFPMAVARVFSAEFRIAMAERILNGESVSALTTELKIKRSVFYQPV